MSDEYRHFKPYVSDEDGRFWLVDDKGRFVTDERGQRIPGPAQRNLPLSGFTSYDTSQGHCGLCGSLTCSGTCFK